MPYVSTRTVRTIKYSGGGAPEVTTTTTTTNDDKHGQVKPSHSIIYNTISSFLISQLIG